MTIEEKREKTRLRNMRWREKNPDGYLKAAAKYRSQNRNKLQEYKLKVRYGISLEEYTLLLQKQDGKCYICGELETATHNFTKNTQNLAVDHCHKSGKVRGLLCQDCNRGIALFKENVSILKKAINYILIHNT